MTGPSEWAQLARNAVWVRVMDRVGGRQSLDSCEMTIGPEAGAALDEEIATALDAAREEGRKTGIKQAAAVARQKRDAVCAPNHYCGYGCSCTWEEDMAEDIEDAIRALAETKPQENEKREAGR